MTETSEKVTVAQPVSWMIRETRAGVKKVICGKVYVREEAAFAAARLMSNYWRTCEAFPLYDHPLEREASDELAALKEQNQFLKARLRTIRRAEPLFISEGFAVLREACRADQDDAATWPRISPGEAKTVRKDLQDARDRIAILTTEQSGS